MKCYKLYCLNKNHLSYNFFFHKVIEKALEDKTIFVQYSRYCFNRLIYTDI